MAAPSKEAMEAFVRWRDEMGLKPTCPACGKTDFGLHNPLVIPIGAPGQLLATNEGAPFQCISCIYCGCVMLFGIGKWPVSPPSNG